ncbi:hypothetical protein HHS34_007565 [Acidithiobacillus montserratensis]|uniref:Uncharacterized protein n=1 Tax=Acidithiobacillus montserratensis TaxID=2729135 RepID=A0ACD5HBF2_9PROT|nr:hypothetical protein [Acidithiobacillus montserratensis]MBN2680225.1 hypothetical protein [Acidithiobacillaceae bacterium]MBU2748310.1 hypothetical protein [Acidithiobacillus montserratensis]
MARPVFHHTERRQLSRVGNMAPFQGRHKGATPNDLEVRLRANGIERLVLELRPEPVEQTEEALA